MSSDQPTVSIIMPTRNHGLYIRETLESVFAQDFKDWELIVVNDGSTDNTEEVLKPYLDHDKVVYLKTTGLGVAGARNLGVRHTKGEYIAFCDSDDIWLSDKLNAQMEYFRTNPQYDAVYGDAVVFNNKGFVHETFKRPYFNPERMFESLIRSNRVPFDTFVCRKSVFCAVGLFDEALRTCEDTDFLIRLAYRHKIGYIDRVFLRIRKHEANISSNPERQFLSKLSILEKISTFSGLTPSHKRAIKSSFAEISFDLAHKYFTEYKIVPARKYFLDSFFYSGWRRWDAVRYFLITLLGGRIIRELKKSTGGAD